MISWSLGCNKHRSALDVNHSAVMNVAQLWLRSLGQTINHFNVRSFGQCRSALSVHHSPIMSIIQLWLKSSTKLLTAVMWDHSNNVAWLWVLIIRPLWASFGCDSSHSAKLLLVPMCDHSDNFARLWELIAHHSATMSVTRLSLRSFDQTKLYLISYNLFYIYSEYFSQLDSFIIILWCFVLLPAN